MNEKLQGDMATVPEALPHDVLVERLARLADQSLALWDLPDGVTARLINLSENATYLVENSAGYRSVLRIHREGYHTRQAISCELAWMRGLNDSDAVITPQTIPGLDGEDIQSAALEGVLSRRFMVMFAFVEGVEPSEDEDLVEPFEELGEIAARTHLHSISWKRPPNFERLTWDFEHMLGSRPNWGDWREAPAMNSAGRAVLERQAALIEKRLAAFGTGPERFGLIHADMRLANLLVLDNSPRLIDFDDCGLGWFGYDFAAGISFMEDHPQVPDLKMAWVKGYRKIRELPQADENEIDTFVSLRRMVLLAWIGSHSETDLAKEQGAEFTRVSVELAETYLQNFS